MNSNRLIILGLILLITILGCSSQVTEEGERNKIEKEHIIMESSYELRNGTSGYTLTYDDLPKEYQLSSGFSYQSMNQRPPLPDGN